MFFFWSILICSANVVYAQTRAQIQACAVSIELISYEANPVWSTDDTTHFYNSTYTYDATSCTSPSKVPVNKIYLMDANGATYSCPAPAFDSTGSLYSQCSQTLGSIAQAAKTGNADWAIIMSMGVKPTVYTIENDFTAGYSDPVQPTGARRRRAQADLALSCLPNESYCPIGRGRLGCVDTSSNLNGEYYAELTARSG
uniref:Ig-like domain-containing protein n=1 Tax=Kwoniella dejecticola CBS 10117 TaxID=1296121 RepID=A0A1A6A8K5_9TREE|nr:uncharacterized protein I303_04118 [Kwoniella dejecticola CBS 10117]OBR86394.1 hypothetical protein I303_04118 [Kwoniella dejecticola CBS 10117]